MDVLRAMRDLADQMRQALAGDGDLDRFAALLHEGWELKRSLGCGISNDRVDEWYEAARRAGAAGGKLLGAGGGGFLLLMAPPWRHRAIREALGGPASCRSGSPATAAGTSSSTIIEIDDTDGTPTSMVGPARAASRRCSWRGGWGPGSVP